MTEKRKVHSPPKPPDSFTREQARKAVEDLLVIKEISAGVGLDEFPRCGIRASSALNLLSQRARARVAEE